MNKLMNKLEFWYYYHRDKIQKKHIYRIFFSVSTILIIVLFFYSLGSGPSEYFLVEEKDNVTYEVNLFYDELNERRR